MELNTPGAAMFTTQRFETLADQNPDRIAVAGGEHNASYGELEARCNRLANHLIDLGVGPEVVVCTHLPPGFDLIVAVLAIGKTGGAFLAIDPQLPLSRKRFMLNESGPRVTINSGSPDWITDDARVVDPVRDSQVIGSKAPSRPGSRIAEGSLSYLFYTSGSTGQPKAVMVPWRDQSPPGDATPHPGEEDRHVLKSSPAFTLVVREIFRPLTSGGRIYLLPEERHQDPDSLLDAIIAHGITLITVVPSVLRALMASPKLPLCRSLRFIDCIGETLPPGLRIEFQKRLPVPLGVTYGCTEAPSVTARVFEPGDDCEHVDLGKPLENRRVYILDDHLNRLPEGETGQIFAGGMLSIGYFKHPRLTAERFIPDPFSSQPGARMYGTGDRGRLSSDGSLIYIGRSDNQVQLGGQRVELGEIEEAIAAHAAVQQAVVMSYGAPSQIYLVAFVVSRGDGLTESLLREHAQSRLPRYMVPARFVLLTTLPLLPSGKLNRAALPVVPPRRNATAERVAPRNSTEHVLADIWLDVLGAEEVHIHDDFFELGGESLTATLIVSRIRDRLNVELPLQCLFERPTIAELAEVIAKA